MKHAFKIPSARAAPYSCPSQRLGHVLEAQGLLANGLVVIGPVDLIGLAMKLSRSGAWAAVAHA